MAKILAILPLSYPLEALEEKVSKLKEPTHASFAEREPQAVNDKTPVQYENQEGALGYDRKTFRVPKGLEKAVQFWILIYSKYSTNHYAIHDIDNFKIYEVVDVSDVRQSGMSDYQKDRRILDRLKDVKEKYENVRAQLGQSDKFKNGIQYSGQYLSIMEDVFRGQGLPLELTRLPFVESMFNNYARSHAGASGLWQFMPGSAQDFSLKVDATCDERNDPIRATLAATKLLKQNYAALGNWPLAITAYNHGKNGMSRIVKKMETDDLVEIINDHSSSTFGFASKNFYAEFLAAVHVEQNYQKYFGQLKIEKPLEFDVIKLDKYIALPALVYYTNISKNTLVELNPAFSSRVLKGTYLIPKGYELRIPQGKTEEFLVAYTRIPKHQKFVHQVRNRYHRIRHGDTLSYLAKKYGTSVQAILEINNLDDSRFIRIGENLRIP